MYKTIKRAFIPTIKRAFSDLLWELVYKYTQRYYYLIYGIITATIQGNKNTL
jgi:hypothetical protein